MSPRFDTAEASLGRIMEELTSLRETLARNELEVSALRQQVDECLDYIRIQHAITRDVLEEARPLLGQRKGRT